MPLNIEKARQALQDTKSVTANDIKLNQTLNLHRHLGNALSHIDMLTDQFEHSFNTKGVCLSYEEGFDAGFNLSENEPPKVMVGRQLAWLYGYEKGSRMRKEIIEVAG